MIFTDAQLSYPLLKRFRRDTVRRKPSIGNGKRKLGNFVFLREFQSKIDDGIRIAMNPLFVSMTCWLYVQSKSDRLSNKKGETVQKSNVLTFSFSLNKKVW